MCRLQVLLLCCCLPIFCWSQQSIPVKGIVFLDKNKNQKYDSGEKAIRNVYISNGRDIVKTNSRGAYEIELLQGEAIFPILPNGYTLSMEQDEKVNNSLFFYPNKDTAISPVLKCDFGLVKEVQPRSFQIGAIGDVQVGDSTELNYAGKSIFRELASREDLAFHVFLGDLVNDDPELFKPFKRMLQALPTPSWTVLGNHDRSFDKDSLLYHRYQEVFGSDSYAFNYGGVHFIVLNNVYPTGQRSYEGRVSDIQLDFLKNTLKTVSHNTQIVVCQHIPLRHTRNRDAILHLLNDFKSTLVLSGHTHQVGRHFYNNGRVQEIITGAPSGSWWTGEVDHQGIPNALMQCGSPRNYFTISFDKESYSIHYKAIGLDTDQQMDMSFVRDTLIANIYGASDSTQVELRLNMGPWQSMEHEDRPAPTVLKLIELNKSKRFPASGQRITPLRRRNSPHIWQLPTDISPGTHIIQIRAFDRFGYSIQTTETLYVPSLN